MNRRLYWRLGALIILICAFVFLLIKEQPEIRQLEKELAEAEKQLEDKNKPKQPVVVNGPPPDEPGFEWVRQGDHWNKVPISEPNAPIVDGRNDTQQKPETVRTPPKQTEDVVMPDGRKWSEYSPEEKKAAKQQNKLMIWVTYDLIEKTKAQVNDAVPKLSLPIMEELYQVMTENPFPYTPEVRVQLGDIGWRRMAAQKEQARLWEEWDKKQEAFREEVKRELEAKRQSGELED